MDDSRTEALVEDLEAMESVDAATAIAPDAEFRRRVVFIGVGIILVSFAYPDSGIGKIPLRFLLLNHLHVQPATMAAFFFFANIPSWCKPIIAIFADSVPLFGTRRRYYLLTAAITGIVVWGLMSVIPHQYAPLLAVAIGLNLLATVGGTINGAIVFEEGRRTGATGRLTSLRSISLNVGSLFLGPLGGFLAARAFGWTCLTGAILFAALFAAGYFLVREPRTAIRDDNAWHSAMGQINRLWACRPLWIAASLMFLIQVAPGFSTPLFYYQTQHLHFSSIFIGVLASVNSAMAFVAGVLYFLLCRRLPLRTLIGLCIGLSVAATLGYLGYRSHPAAVVVEGCYGLATTLATLSLFDLTARSTPPGAEALGYAVMYAFINIAVSANDWVGSKLFEMVHQQFNVMVWINALTTAVVLLAIPFLPKILVNHRDGEIPA